MHFSLQSQALGLFYHSPSFKPCLCRSRALEPFVIILALMLTNPYHLKIQNMCLGLYRFSYGSENKASVQFSQQWLQIIICVDIHPYPMAFGPLQLKKYAGQFSFIRVSYDFFNKETLRFSSDPQVISSWDILSIIFHLHQVDRFLRKSSSQCKVNKFDQTKSYITLQVWPKLKFFILHHIELTPSTKVLYSSLSTTFMLSTKASFEWKGSIGAKTFQVS